MMAEDQAVLEERRLAAQAAMDAQGGKAASTSYASTGMSKEGAEAAKQTGVAYSDVGKPRAVDDAAYKDYDAGKVGSALGENVAFKEGGEYVSDRSTVKGQLSSLLSEESPYIQQAKLGAERQAAGRGMLNTSMAAGAGQAAAIKAALPIAQQDAQTFATAESMQQQVEYNLETMQSEAIISGEMVKQEAQIKQTSQNINNAFQARLQAADAQGKVALQDMMNEYNKGMAAIEHKYALAQQSQVIAAERKQLATTQATTAMSNAQITIENWMSDPTFLDMDLPAQRSAMNGVMTMARNEVKMIGAVSGVDLRNIADAYIKNITFK